MILRRFGITDPAWLAIVLVTIVFLSAIEPYNVPGAPPRGPANDIIRWMVQIPNFLACIGLLMLTRGWWARIALTPAKWLVAFAVWQLATASLGLKPQVSTLLSLGMLAYVCLGAVLTANGGWARARNYLTFAMAMVMVASGALYATGQGGFLRLEGIMNHPNALGGGAGIAMVLFLHRFLRGQNWALGLFLLSGVLVYLTDSRTALAGAFLGLMILMGDLWPRWVIPAVFAVLFAIVTVVTQTDLLTENAESLSRSGSAEELSSLTGRTDIWSIAVAGIEDSVVHGYGPGSTTDLFAEIKPDNVLGTFEINHAHNMWLQLALIGGLPSALLVTIGFFDYLRATRGRRIRDRDAIVLSLLIFGVSEPVFSAEPNVFLIMLASAFASVGAGDSEPVSLPTSTPVRSLAT